jgi:TatD DNase family protein
MIDSHCHLADQAFSADLPQVVRRAVDAGVTAALCILSADDPGEVARATGVTTAWPAVRFAAAVHPHRAAAYRADPEAATQATAAAVSTVGAVAVGEIGLDYHYDLAPRAVQRTVFAAQVALAGTLGLPVVIHTRESADDTLAVLGAAAPQVGGVMHCFSGTVDEARRALDLGFYISLSGMATFRKASNVRDLAAYVPDDRLLVETDAPYLAPVPHRGARNEPAFLVDTLRAIATLRHRPPEALAALVVGNLETMLGRSF